MKKRRARKRLTFIEENGNYFAYVSQFAWGRWVPYMRINVPKVPEFSEQWSKPKPSPLFDGVTIRRIREA